MLDVEEPTGTCCSRVTCLLLLVALFFPEDSGEIRGRRGLSFGNRVSRSFKEQAYCCLDGRLLPHSPVFLAR